MRNLRGGRIRAFSTLRGTNPRRRACLLLASAAAWSLFAASSALGATVTVGSPLTGSFAPASTGAVDTYTNVALPEAGAHVVSPVTGTIVRWRITGATGGPFRLRVLTKVSGTTYTGAGTSTPQMPSSTGTLIFTTNLPIKAGQAIGIDNGHASDQIGFSSTFVGTGSVFWVPPLADNSTRAGNGPNTGEAGFNADVQTAKVVKCVVPKLKGKTLKAAKKALKKNHCKLGKVKGPKKHKVKKQKPKPGTVLAAGSKVSVKMKK